MANTYTQIFIQIVFAVKGRQNLIAKENREELHKLLQALLPIEVRNCLQFSRCPITFIF